MIGARRHMSPYTPFCPECGKQHESTSCPPTVTSTGQIVYSVRQLLNSPHRKAAREVLRRAAR
jgi:hypothetical protein